MEENGRGTLPAQELRSLGLRLREALGADAVLEGDACLAYGVQGHVPAMAARPASVAHLSVALAAAHDAGASVIPWGGGTRQAIGYVPRRYDLVLSVERLHRVLTYDAADLTITVEAGMTHAALARVLAEQGQMLPLDVPRADRATLAGTLACGSAGLRRIALGTPRDLTLGLRVALADGTLITTGGRVVKNVTGYDMTKLFLGSYGTLGIIAEASFKLLPLPEREVTVVAVLSGVAEALAAAGALASLALRPTALALSSAHAFPHLGALVAEGSEQAVLAVRLAGTAAAVERTEREARAILQPGSPAPLVALAGDSVVEFWQAAADLAALDALAATVAVLRVTTLPTRVAELIAAARATTARERVQCAWLADVSAGMIWLRVTARPEAEAARKLGDALGNLQADLLARGCQCVILTCAPGLKARLPLWGEAPAGMALMREVKRRFDPDGRLNPGRSLPGLDPTVTPRASEA